MSSAFSRNGGMLDELMSGTLWVVATVANAARQAANSRSGDRPVITCICRKVVGHALSMSRCEEVGRLPPQVRFTSVEFRDYKALGRYHLSLQRMNVMVGPNNSGKSTIVGAFRVLGAGIRRARARSPETCFVGNKSVLGYRLSDDTLPISLENVHTDLGEIDSSVSFRLSNGNHLHLQFPRDGGCVMVAETQGRRVTSPTGF
jgi:hypothetical protein